MYSKKHVPPCSFANKLKLYQDNIYLTKCLYVPLLSRAKMTALGYLMLSVESKQH